MAIFRKPVASEGIGLNFSHASVAYAREADDEAGWGAGDDEHQVPADS